MHIIFFESELRMNLIINKIDDVIKHLEKIEQHQYMLYSAIQENNKQVNQLSGELTMLVNNSCQIEENTRMTEYYAWISAKYRSSQMEELRSFVK